jgi:uncharacterized membrane protein
MGECLVSKFPGRSAAHQASIALEKLRGRGATIYAWAVVCKDSDGRISVSDRRKYQGEPATVAALIGGLAGFVAAGPIGAMTGAISGALVGSSADSIERESHSKLLNTISHEVANDTAVLIAEVAPADTGSVEALIRHCGGTILHSATQQSALSLLGR